MHNAVKISFVLLLVGGEGDNIFFSAWLQAMCHQGTEFSRKKTTIFF